jgi:hypothetical protein
MKDSTTPLSPVQQADQALQVVGMLSRIETRFEDGGWRRGVRAHPGGGNCLIGAIDEAAPWVMPGVADETTAQLAARLPRGLRAVARLRPRLALALYNDTRGRERALELVARTRQQLGGLPRHGRGAPAGRGLMCDPAARREERTWSSRAGDRSKDAPR